MTGTPLTADEIQKLLSLPTRQARQASSGTSVSLPGSGKKVRIDLSVRTLPMWWKLPTTHSNCQVAAHDENESNRNRMCYDLEGVMVCRYCYLNSRD
jgi:hypothetical protein